MQMRRIWVLIGWLVIFNVVAQGQRLTDPAVATKLGLSVQQLHTLRAQSALDNNQLLALSPTRIQLLLLDAAHPGIDKHAEAQNFEALRMMDEHGRIPPEGLQRALQHRRHDSGGGDSDLLPGAVDPSPIAPVFGTPEPLLAGIRTNGWTWLGPGNVGGRVRAILVHPAFPNILWCGGVDGGVWKSTNSGVAWFPLNDFMANLAISCLVLDPANPDTIYAGTGEATHNGDAIRGAGIFKSTDGGTNWVQLPSTVGTAFQYVGRLAIDPNNSQVLLAATRSGIYRSADSGTTWTQGTATETLDLQFHPNDSSQAIASGLNGSAWYSLDGGASWTTATGLPTSGRVEVTYARSAPSCVYASAESGGGQIYRSSDGGQSYTLINTGDGYLGNQGWYGNAIWVDPTTTNVLVVGGIDLWRSIDGGVTLTQISQWQIAPASAHADHHAIVAGAAYNGTTVRTVYFGNDGGVYSAADIYNVSQGSGWQSLNNNLGITQFYGGAGNSNTGVIIGGTQDNGTLRYSGDPESWSEMYGGDGGFCAADPSDPNYFYGEYVFLQIHRSTDGGGSASSIFSGITDAGSSSGANFIAPFILDPNNPNTMLAGGLSLWRSTNVKGASPAWSAIKSSNGSRISAIAVAPGNSDIIWVGHNNGSVYYTTNGTAPSPIWYQANLGTPNLPARYCGRIAISRVDSNRVYVVFGGFNFDNVWRTTDSGMTWSNISGNLPAAPVNSIVLAPSEPGTLYVGTQVGVYGSSTDGATWSSGNDGPANVAVDELFWVGNKLVAATHGRGMYATTPALGAANLVAAWSVISGGNGNGLVDPNECNQLTLALQNAGGASATNIYAWLTIDTPGVSVIQGQAAYPDLASTDVGTNNIAFQINTSPGLACGTPITAKLTAAFNGTTNLVCFALPSGGANYTITQSTGASIVRGTTDTGNHADDGMTTIALPFSFSLYGRGFTNASLSSNGNLQFQSADSYWNNTCLPYSGFSYAIIPFWDDLKTDTPGSGIFTSLSGSAPNRIFNLEWRATYYSSGASVNFEVRLYEGQSRFDIIYGALNGDGSTATAGVQKDGTSYTGFECNAGGLSPGLQLTIQQSCTDGGGPCPPPNVAPSIAVQPQGQTLVLGTNASFTITAGGTPAPAYQWRFGGVVISGETASILSLTNVQCVDAGAYDVVVTNIAGSVTSSVAVLTVIAPPAIVTDPEDQTVAIGTVASFMVNATNDCGGGLMYQWQLGGTNIGGATDSVLTLSNAQPIDAGFYTAVVTNLAGAATSAVAVLTVVPPPLLVVVPAYLDFGTILTGATAQASLLVSNAGGLSLTGSAMIVSGPFNFDSPTQAVVSVPAFTATNLLLDFVPFASGSYSNNLVFDTDGGAWTESLLGRAVDTFAPLILLPPQTDGQFTFSFETIPGKTYYIESLDDFADLPWQPRGSVPGDGSLKTVTNTISNTNKLYRLRVQ